MSFVTVVKDNGIATVMLERGKVNALSEDVVDELHDQFERIEKDDTVRAVILTGKGKFFTFGFDIPGFLSYTIEDFTRYLKKFTDLYAYIFTFPRPVIAALNGHTIAGGCMIAAACDLRIMVTGKAKISLNEITFGSSLFAGSLAILKYLVGTGIAQEIAYTGKMYAAAEALELGLIEKVTSEQDLPTEALEAAQDFARKDGAAFASIKRSLRKPVAEEISRSEDASVREFATIWYSEGTWKNLQTIKITG